MPSMLRQSAGRAVSWRMGLLTLSVCVGAYAQAATLTVTNTNDDGPGSLRQAVASTPFTAGADIIAFDIASGGTQTITLTTGEMPIAGDVTIDGSTQPGFVARPLITISGNNASRIFNVSGGTVTLNALRIVNGFSTKYGGGVVNDAALTVTNCWFSNNMASRSSGGIASGGGISNTGTLTVSNSTFNDNTTSQDGGGIENRGIATVTNSTFYKNAARRGGGLSNIDGLSTTLMTVSHCTISGNSAIKFGGGIHRVLTGGDNTLNLGNTIVANNVADASGGDIYGDYVDSGFNIVEDGSGILAATSMPGDPLLGPLADNGGPTPTLALLAGSIAINAGDCDGGAVTEDQRGVARPVGSACDIGAYEAELVDLAITKSNNQSLVVPGKPVTYTITVTNAGPSAAVNASVADDFPAALENVSYTSVASGGAGGNTAVGEGNIDDLVTLPAGGAVVYMATGKVMPDLTGRLESVASVTAPFTVVELDATNNTAIDSDRVDSDGDGTADEDDGCPNDAAKTTPGACGCGVADTDSDSDGTPDCSDGCPNDANKTSLGACGCGVADTDTDGDGVPDCIDNCPALPNADQADADGNGVGDACDASSAQKPADSDGDGVPDDVDNCPNTANPDQADADGDGSGDVCDDTPSGGDNGNANQQTPDPNEPNATMTTTTPTSSACCGTVSFTLLAFPTWWLLVWSRRRRR